MSAATADHPGYRLAFLDWLACAWAGRKERAVVAARSLADPVTTLGVAGHVLDFDDTYAPGLAHLTAPTAPAALVVGAATTSTIGEVLDAYAAGFEAMAALAAAGHPALYEGGWHPTAVTGTIGAATAAAILLDLPDGRTRTARRLAVLGAAGMQAAFGSDGKSLQVGMAAGHGVRAARLAAAGAEASVKIESAYEAMYKGRWVESGGNQAIVDNWTKAYPCCLQTHSSIEAAMFAVQQGATSVGEAVVVVHRRSRQAAPLDDVATGLEAKFSIPYTVAIALSRGAPSLDDFRAVDSGLREAASRIRVRTDDALGEAEARLQWRNGKRTIETKVEFARGSPRRPMTEDELHEKVTALAGNRFDGVLDDPSLPAANVLELLDAE